MAILCVALLSSGDSVALAQQAEQQNAAPAEEAPKIPNDQLDSLVAPIALYPDPLLSQTLVASTYPLEIIQLQQWLEKNKNLKDKALADAVEKQNWDPSIQAMAALPAVVKQLGDNIAWTSDLGNAFLAQQADVMDAVQRMRAKAEGAGNLKTSQQQKVETNVVEGKSVVVIEQASPDVVYVPSYNPTVVYGPPVYPYPPIYYPPPGYYAAGAAISFGVGVAVGAAWGGHWGGWGFGCGWGHNDINVNVNNKYVNHYNKTNINNKITSGNNNWQHNPQHRGAAPYSNRATANKYGGTARQQPAGGAGNRPGGGAGAANRPGGGAGAANRPGGGAGNAGANRPGGAGNAGANRSGGGGARASNAGANRSGSGGGDRIGGRNVPSGGSRGSAFGGASSGFSGSSARASSSRGGHSMGASRGGGSRGGGGGRGGGGRRR
jgi:hypothetical protein